jgi:transmembrane sensor
MRLAAGEEVSVAKGHFNKQAHPNVVEALSWRERRLMFRDTPLSDVAAEFNRYNLRQIRVEGPIEMELTGTFDADRPTALILYAMRQPSLDVIQVGDNWIIRSK